LLLFKDRNINQLLASIWIIF